MKVQRAPTSGPNAQGMLESCGKACVSLNFSGNAELWLRILVPLILASTGQADRNRAGSELDTHMLSGDLGVCRQSDGAYMGLREDTPGTAVIQKTSVTTGTEAGRNASQCKGPEA